MFSHSVHQLEKSGSLEGHQTHIVHECLQVAAAFGWYHRWQCRVNLHEIFGENADWNVKNQRLPRMIFNTSTVRCSHSWVMPKTRRLPTLNSSDAVTTMSTSMGGLLATSWQEGNCPLRNSLRRCTHRSTRKWSPGLKIAWI